MQLVLDEVLSNLEWPHSLGARQDKFFLHLVLFVLQKELGLIKHCKSHLGISMSPISCRDLCSKKEKTNLNTVKVLHISSYMMYMLQFSIEAVICIFQAVCQFFCEYLIILAQRGKNRSGD